LPSTNLPSTERHLGGHVRGEAERLESRGGGRVSRCFGTQNDDARLGLTLTNLRGE
jgi:hypothetical protein